MISQASCVWEERLKNQKTKGVSFFVSLYFCISSIFFTLLTLKTKGSSLFFSSSSFSLFLGLALKTVRRSSCFYQCCRIDSSCILMNSVVSCYIGLHELENFCICNFICYINFLALWLCKNLRF